MTNDNKHTFQNEPANRLKSNTCINRNQMEHSLVWFILKELNNFNTETGCNPQKYKL